RAVVRHRKLRALNDLQAAPRDVPCGAASVSAWLREIDLSAEHAGCARSSAPYLVPNVPNSCPIRLPSAGTSGHEERHFCRSEDTARGSNGGHSWVRTSDPLLVRQVLFR